MKKEIKNNSYLVFTSIITFFCFYFSFRSLGENDKANIKALKNLKIFYASSPWNKDSTNLDSAFLFFRDAKTGKIAKITIEETEPDSSTFEGNFSISWANNVDSLEPEVYIPPENMREQSKDSLTKFYQLLNTKQVMKKPMVFRTSTEGQKIVEVYDTSEQAQRAEEAFKKEAELARQAEEAKKALAQPLADPAAIEASKMAERQVALGLMAQEAARREADRVRLEQIEKQRSEERIKQQQFLLAKERQKREEQAKQYAEMALDLYRVGKFKEAEEAFRQSIQLDPSNKDYYFKYAITLYRNEKFNEALVAMKIATPPEEEKWQKEYYMGLIHFRLKEFDSALKKFALVQEAKDAQLSPSAAFYQGVILFNQENFEAAKLPFEWVIDYSQDATLDQRAEEYLEKIAHLLTYQKNKNKKMLFSATLGAMYDSNVLLATDNVLSQGSSTKEGDVRAVIGGNFEYRLFSGKSHELSGAINSSYIRSTKSELSIADPIQNTLTLPYTYKGTLGKKGYRLSLTPGYEIVHMSIETDGAQKNILNSIMMNMDNTLIMNDRWYASYIFEIRHDDSLLTSSVGDANADAMKYSIKTSQMFFRDKNLREAVIASLGLVNNAATGADKIYFRVEGGVSYIRPVLQNDSWNLGLSTYHLNYGQSAEKRKDTNVSLTSGYNHPFNEWAAGSLTFTYSSNQSNVATNQYSRFALMALGIFNWGR